MAAIRDKVFVLIDADMRNRLEQFKAEVGISTDAAAIRVLMDAGLAKYPDPTSREILRSVVMTVHREIFATVSKMLMEYGINLRDAAEAGTYKPGGL